LLAVTGSIFTVQIFVCLSAINTGLIWISIDLKWRFFCFPLFPQTKSCETSTGERKHLHC